jgi:DeoR family glycerol-3-phosphate regulon repressor
MRPTARRDRIMELLVEHRRLTVEELAQQLGASPETIRRDLTELAARDVLRKFHGGAALPESGAEGAFQARMAENLPAKRAIARRAAGLFAAGDTIFVDTGSTTIAFAAALAQVSGLTVITNSVAVAGLLSRSGANRAILLGGEHRHDAGENLGPLALRQIEGFRPRHAVVTVGALGPEGALDFDLQEAEIARAMIERAEAATVLADASKFGRSALYRLCPLERISRLVTEKAPPPGLAKALQVAGVELILAPPNDRMDEKTG